MRTPAQVAGDAAETMVAARLAEAGWVVLGRHIRVSRAEIDLLAVDPGPPRELVAVEVRWRASRGFGLPEETIGWRKRTQLHQAGFGIRSLGHLADGTPIPNLPIRFDLVVVEPGEKLRHHRYAI